MMASKTDGALSSPWTSNGFDGMFGQTHPPFALSKWTEFEGAAQAATSKPPTSRGNPRFGSLSYNSFFSRHNPHPIRVTHLKGLLDMPICVVNDDGYFANPRYALQFPPNNFNRAKINRWETGGRNKTPRSGLITPNISNGGQSKISKKKYGNGVWRDMNSIPYNGTEAWRDELKMLTEALTKASDDENTCPAQHPNGNIPQTDRPGKKRSTQYSAETGRIIESSSLSRGKLNSRKQRMKSSSAQLENIIEKSSSEVLVLQLLCQILDTEDISEVKKWLTTAPDRERAFAFELLKVALSSSGEDQIGHQLQLLPSLTEEQPDQLIDLLPPITAELDSVNKIDRLIIDHEAVQKNKDDLKSCDPIDAEQCPRMTQKSDRATLMQCKMPKVSNVKKTPLTSKEPKQNGQILMKNSPASKAQGARSSPSKGKEETADLVSDKTQGGLHQSPERSIREPEDSTKPGCALQRSHTIV